MNDSSTKKHEISITYAEASVFALSFQLLAFSYNYELFIMNYALEKAPQSGSAFAFSFQL